MNYFFRNLYNFWKLGIAAVFAIVQGGTLMACEIQAEVRAYDPSGLEIGHADSMRAALDGRDMTDPAMIFALEAEAALRAMLINNDACQQARSIKLELIFVEMKLFAKAEHIERLHEITQGRTGPYATVSIDRERASVRAIVEWNPRQILRDQLSLLGWPTDAGQAFPFEQTALFGWADLYSEKVLGPAPSASSVSAWEELKTVIPPDLFGIFSQRHPLSTRGGVGSFALSLVHSLLEISQPGYFDMTEIAIRRALDDPAAPPVTSVKDAAAAGFPQPYEKLRWLRPASAKRQLNWE